MPTRRQFLVNCSTLAVTASMVPATFGAPWRTRDVPLDRIGPGDFARQLNAAFYVQVANGAAVELRLIEVRPATASKQDSPNSEDAHNEKFTLRFRGPLATPLDQDTHQFEQPRIGRFAMFIVPIGCLDQSHCYYEAVFNRPVPGSKARNIKAQLR